MEPLCAPKGFSIPLTGSDFAVTTICSHRDNRESFACGKVQHRGFQQLGFLMDRICNFKMVTPKKTFYPTFWLTTDGRTSIRMNSPKTIEPSETRS